MLCLIGLILPTPGCILYSLFILIARSLSFDNNSIHGFFLKGEPGPLSFDKRVTSHYPLSARMYISSAS
jgi:hypothetical protein